MGLFSKKINSGIKAADMIAGVIDKFIFTKEERLDTNQRMQATIIRYAEKTFDGTTTRGKARRTLAFSFCGLYLFLILLKAFLFLANMFYFIEPNGDNLLELIKTLSPAVVTIIFFYFGSYGIESLMAKSKEQEQGERIDHRNTRRTNRDERRKNKLNQ